MSQLLTIFSGESNKQLNYTVQPVAMESGQAWDRSTPTYMCPGSLLMSLLCLFFFLLHFLLAHTQLYSTHQGTQLNGMGHEKSTDTMSAPGGLPHCFTLDVWLPTRETARLWNHCVSALCDSAFAVLCTVVHTHVARCWLHCLLPGGLKLIIHTLSHQCSHTHCNPDIPAPSPCRVSSCKCLFLQC